MIDDILRGQGSVTVMVRISDLTAVSGILGNWNGSWLG